MWRGDKAGAAIPRCCVADDKQSSSAGRPTAKTSFAQSDEAGSRKSATETVRLPYFGPAKDRFVRQTSGTRAFWRDRMQAANPVGNNPSDAFSGQISTFMSDYQLTAPYRAQPLAAGSSVFRKVAALAR